MHDVAISSAAAMELIFKTFFKLLLKQCPSAMAISTMLRFEIKSISWYKLKDHLITLSTSPNRKT